MYYVEYEDYSENENGINKTSEFFEKIEDAEIECEILTAQGKVKNCRIIKQ